MGLLYAYFRHSCRHHYVESCTRRQHKIAGHGVPGLLHVQSVLRVYIALCGSVLLVCRINHIINEM